MVSQLNKHNSDPKISNMKIAKKVVRYLKDIMHLGLVYGAQTKDKRETKVWIASSLFGLVVYGNSSYAGDPKDTKVDNEILLFYKRSNSVLVQQKTGDNVNIHDQS